MDPTTRHGASSVSALRTAMDDRDMSDDDPQAANDWSESLLRSGTWPTTHLIALGRVLEEAATAERYARDFVLEAFDAPPAYASTEARRALAIQNSGLVVVLLGARMTDLVNWLGALASLEGMPPWLKQATDWGKKARPIFELRNDLVHRPPTQLVGPASSLAPGMARARRAHRVEPIGDAAPELLRKLVVLNHEAFQLAWHIAEYQRQQREALGLQ
jgi:hypothetical protein